MSRASTEAQCARVAQLQLDYTIDTPSRVKAPTRESLIAACRARMTAEQAQCAATVGSVASFDGCFLGAPEHQGPGVGEVRAGVVDHPFKARDPKLVAPPSIRYVRVSARTAPTQALRLSESLAFVVVVTNEEATEVKILNPLDSIVLVVKDSAGRHLHLRPRAKSARPYRVDVLDAKITFLPSSSADDTVLALYGGETRRFLIRIDQVLGPGKYTLDLQLAIKLADDPNVYRQLQTGPINVELLAAGNVTQGR